jgi:hypothetical protein
VNVLLGIILVALAIPVLQTILVWTRHYVVVRSAPVPGLRPGGSGRCRWSLQGFTGLMRQGFSQRGLLTPSL